MFVSNPAVNSSMKSSFVAVYKRRSWREESPEILQGEMKPSALRDEPSTTLLSCVDM